MKIIPVIDILNGVVVHAVRGRRSEYKPLQSVLCKSTDPIEVANSFKRLGFGELYVADLDAIINETINFRLHKRIVDETNLLLMVDAGVNCVKFAEKLLKCGVSRVVLGTETLQKKEFVAESIRLFGNERVILSLDLKNGEVMIKSGFIGCSDSLQLLNNFKEMGVKQVIILDLDRVGSGEGINVDFLRKMLSEVNVDFYIGGGIRDIADLVELRALGVSGVLVATALHTGKISIDDIKQNGLIE